MDNDPVLFDSTELETASEAVQFCKLYLEERGFGCADLEGLVPITNADLGRLVTDALRKMLPNVRHAQAAEYLRIALHTTVGAVRAASRAQLVA